MNPSEILKLVRANPDKSIGICANYAEVAEKHTPIIPVDLDPLFLLWEHYSGRIVYPIPATTVKEDEVPALFSQPEVQYNRAYNRRQLWDKRTKYGRLRHELLDHLIYWSEVLECLREMKAGHLPNPKYGICANLHEIYGEKYGDFCNLDIEQLFPSWEHYSGDPMFPIKDSEAKYTQVNYKPWEEQARHDLLDHCIKVLSSCSR